MSGIFYSPDTVSHKCVIPVLVTGIHSAEVSSAFYAASLKGLDPRHKAEGDDHWFGTQAGKTFQ